MIIGYRDLLTCWRKGLRNGNWRRLGMMERIFYRAAMWFLRAKGMITGKRIVGQLMSLIERLGTTIRQRIMKVGIGRVAEILLRCKRNGIFRWASRLKAWFRDPEYVFWLGLNSCTP